MKESFYGRVMQTSADDSISRHAEEVAVRGFTVIPNLFAASELSDWRQRIDRIYAEQEADFGRDALIAIQELDICRAPLLYDLKLIELATHPFILSVVRQFLGDWFILNLQNANITRPRETHQQGLWHRDLPYQNWVTSRPLAINALLAIDEFSDDTGGTQVLPFSHKSEFLPSDQFIAANSVMAAAPAGSAVIFDSMLFHRAGVNRSGTARRSVNHLYSTPIMKQQYDFPRALGDQPGLDPDIARLLGYTSQVPVDDRAWRSARAARIRGTK